MFQYFRKSAVSAMALILAGSMILQPAGVSAASTKKKNLYTLSASDLKHMSNTQFIESVGAIAQDNYQKTGVLASVTVAQAIVESGWGKSSLAQKGNNLFGMKASLSGNNWKGTTWTGKTIRRKGTRWRKYSTAALSIADHSAYLTNAKNGSRKRYAGLTTTKSYSKQIAILQKGGYCVGGHYASQLKKAIRKYHLTRFDHKNAQ